MVRDVTALHQDGRAAGFVEHGEILALSSLPVLEFQSAQQAQVNMCSQAFALFAKVVSLHAVVTCAGVGVEMDADKNSVTVAVGDDGPVVE